MFLPTIRQVKPASSSFYVLYLFTLFTLERDLSLFSSSALTLKCEVLEICEAKRIRALE